MQLSTRSVGIIVCPTDGGRGDSDVAGCKVSRSGECDEGCEGNGIAPLAGLLTVDGANLNSVVCLRCEASKREGIAVGRDGVVVVQHNFPGCGLAVLGPSEHGTGLRDIGCCQIRRRGYVFGSREVCACPSAFAVGIYTLHLYRIRCFGCESFDAVGTGCAVDKSPLGCYGGSEGDIVDKEKVLVSVCVAESEVTLLACKFAQVDCHFSPVASGLAGLIDFGKRADVVGGSGDVDVVVFVVTAIVHYPELQNAAQFYKGGNHPIVDVVCAAAPASGHSHVFAAVTRYFVTKAAIKLYPICVVVALAVADDGPLAQALFEAVGEDNRTFCD